MSLFLHNVYLQSQMVLTAEIGWRCVRERETESIQPVLLKRYSNRKHICITHPWHGLRYKIHVEKSYKPIFYLPWKSLLPCKSLGVVLYKCMTSKVEARRSFRRCTYLWRVMGFPGVYCGLTPALYRLYLLPWLPPKNGFPWPVP